MSQKAGNAPLPWSWEWADEGQLMLYDAEDNVIGQLYENGGEAEAQALCDAVNNEWAHKHNAEEAAEYIEFLKGEREKLARIIRELLPIAKTEVSRLSELLSIIRRVLGNDQDVVLAYNAIEKDTRRLLEEADKAVGEVAK